MKSSEIHENKKEAVDTSIASFLCKHQLVNQHCTKLQDPFFIKFLHPTIR